jgi:antitoxin FitA
LRHPQVFRRQSERVKLASRSRRSTEAEIRAILDAAVRPAEEIRIGSCLAKLGRRFRRVELNVRRETVPAQPMRFE